MVITISLQSKAGWFEWRALRGAGELKDTRAGWNRYEKYLQWLSEDEPERKRMGEARELAWESGLAAELRCLGKDDEAIQSEAKAAPWKVAIAGLMKAKHNSTNGWLARHLRMGVDAGVSRYVAEMAAGRRRDASKLHRKLIANIS